MDHIDNFYKRIEYLKSQKVVLDKEIELLKQQRDIVYNKENAYLEKKKDGTYIFHVGGIEEKVLEEDVEKGLYDKYLIINE